MENYNFNPTPKGSTFGPFSISLEEDGVPLIITDVCMQLKKNERGAAVHTFENTITDGTVDFDEWIVDVPAFNYVYDIKLTLEDGRILTTAKGTLQITQNVSECQ